MRWTQHILPPCTPPTPLRAVARGTEDPRGSQAQGAEMWRSEDKPLARPQRLSAHCPALQKTVSLELRLSGSHGSRAQARASGWWAGPGEATLSCQKQPERQGTHPPPVDRRDQSHTRPRSRMRPLPMGLLASRRGTHTHTHKGSQARTPESPSAGGTASWAPGSSSRGAGVTRCGTRPAPPTRSRWKQSRHPRGGGRSPLTPPALPSQGP